eukprot:TRINITY_DN3423_c0_g3_i1.p1 TRINITY_DN3423_c0_g3~~TRINITY_DN3423_c0_g3_i1.p1  ORF type:complete len:332 (-),score=58.64 TRINITY_DN3423_c0_g3_i1:121-1116(-)
MVVPFLYQEALLVLASFCSAQDYSDKTPYYPDGLSTAFSLDDYIQTPPYTAVPTANTSNCLADQCDNSVTAYTVTYASDPFSVTVCICDNAVMDLATMAQKFGKVPYLVRATPVLSITAASVGKGGGAFTVGDRIAFFDVGEVTEVFVHEAAHVFDASTLSFTQEWLDDIDADTCVPDGYAQTNAVEDFAQVLVTWTYYVVSRNVDNAPSCMANQIDYLSEVLPAEDILSHLACTLSISQTLNSNWVTNGIQYSEYTVVFTNTGYQPIEITVDLGGIITDIWNMVSVGSTKYTLPSYLTNGLGPSSTHTWGYIIASGVPAIIDVVDPIGCS